MKSLNEPILKLLIFALFILCPLAAQGQNARLRFENLNGLETKARDVVEVNVEGKILDLAKRVLAKTSDEDSKKVGKVCGRIAFTVLGLGVAARRFGLRGVDALGSSAATGAIGSVRIGSTCGWKVVGMPAC